MASPLVPCPSCARHVRAGEPACPFCAAALPADLEARAIPASPRRLGRAAAFVFGATLSVTACSSEITTSGGTTTGGGGATGSGGAKGNGGGSNATTGTGPDDDGGMQTHYGTPVFDAGGGGSPAFDGGGGPLYGAPPILDAGHPDGGFAAYGSPPPPPQGDP